jgi:hypothetical protein
MPYAFGANAPGACAAFQSRIQNRYAGIIRTKAVQDASPPRAAAWAAARGGAQVSQSRPAARARRRDGRRASAA